MNLSEFTDLDSAILEKSNENFPACWTVVKWPALTCSVYCVKIHFRAKLDLTPLRVTRKLVSNGAGKIPGQRALSLGNRNNNPSKPRFESSRTLRRAS
jgi:hypothetical protein